ncbi:MAG: anthranilate phosphoribosyltransferase [Thermomicrobiales bacterium]
MLRAPIQAIVDGERLTREEATSAMQIIMNGEASQPQIGAFLTALRMRGESDEELAGFADVMREKAVKVPYDPGDQPLVDTCGTGGDVSGSFNISTTAAFVVAGAGVRVAKHGNRAMTSRCGSADVLEGLGVRIELEPEQVAECIDRVGIGFMYAPAFHPAMRFAGPVRREIGIRTVFNLLGPLVNPAGATHQVVGVPDVDTANRVARVMGMLGSRHALVVHAHEGLDELGVAGTSTIAEMLMRESAWVTAYEVEPERYGLSRHPLDEISGGGVQENVRITEEVLCGTPGARRDITLLNAGAAIYAADAASTIEEGIQAAARSIDSGAASAKVRELVELTQRISSPQTAGV